MDINKVAKISITPVEFVWKLSLTLFGIMPVSIIGGAFAVYQVALTMDCTSPLFIVLGGAIGTILGIFLTMILIMTGHRGE